MEKETIVHGIYDEYYYQINQIQDDPISYFEVFLELPEGITLTQLKKNITIKNLLNELGAVSHEEEITSWNNNNICQIKGIQWSTAPTKSVVGLNTVIFTLIDLYKEYNGAL